jgi:hypothetical protein
MVLPFLPSNLEFHIHKTLAKYPILSDRIRARMRRELFKRKLITEREFEAELRNRAIQTQKFEGIKNPFLNESPDVWELRISRLREILTDAYFASNLPIELFEQIIQDVLKEQGVSAEDIQSSVNPESAPQNVLFDQALAIEKLPPAEREKNDARLREIKVVLIRSMISDQLAYIKIAKDWFTIKDLLNVRQHKIGPGKIGGKSAGMLLAANILSKAGDKSIKKCLRTPESFFIGADVLYIFMTSNNLLHWGDQKYKTDDQIREEYPTLVDEFVKASFPEDILENFGELLEKVGNKPIIVRSSSLLEDSFVSAFVGKYESYFLPNQGTHEENLSEFTTAIKKIYASTLSPDALIYRREKGLQDYDERMALLIQVVQGKPYKDYFFPDGAGVATSQNFYRWSPKFKLEDGFARLVWGLGTRAVERSGNDYTRLVSLSHPLLVPETSIKEIQHYSQHFIDLIDLKKNKVETLPAEEVLSGDYPALKYIVQVDKGGYLSNIRMTLKSINTSNLVITFDGLLRNTNFARNMRKVLKTLEMRYNSPVDIEFVVNIKNLKSQNPRVVITLLQCRPQRNVKEVQTHIPEHLSKEEIIFSTTRIAPHGYVNNIQYVVFVPPDCYFSLSKREQRNAVVQTIGQLNVTLDGKSFICVGPGRWGTNNPDLGIGVGYSDIYNARALVEITGTGIGPAPEASFGTHFFQDLVESDIFPLAIFLDDKDTIFNKSFFYNTPNSLDKFLKSKSKIAKCVKLIEVGKYKPGYHIELTMNAQEGHSIAFLEKDK